MNGFWICADETPSKTQMYCFEHKFTAKDGAEMKASVCADSRYKLYVNDELVCDGPCRGSQYIRYYEEPDITPYLKAGENTIRAEVIFLTENVFISVFREHRPALWFNGILNENGQTRQIYSDESWTCRRLDSIVFSTPPGMMTSIPPAEFVSGEDSYTSIPVRRMYEPNIENGCFNPWGGRELYPLGKRIIPFLKPGARKPFTVSKQDTGLIDLDAGVYTTSLVDLCFEGKKGTKLYIKYSECYQGEDGEKRMRDDSTGTLNGYQDIIVLTGKPQTYSTFFFRAFRYVRLEFEDKEMTFDIEKSGYREYFYPLDEDGSFKCSDERLNRIWDISRNTVKCCMHELFVDCPYYEQQQYGMDSALEIMFSLRMSSDTRLIKKAITDFVHSQLPDGMLQANFPSTSVQVIPTFSLYWLLMLREYLRYCGDVRFVRSLTGTVDKVLQAFDNLINEDGLVGPTHYWPYTDWVPKWYCGVPEGGRQEPLTVYCLIYATALGAAEEICSAVGREALAKEYAKRRDAMIKAVNEKCFDAEAQMYRDTPTRRDFSEHTALWAVLSGAVKGEKATKLMEKVMNEDVSRCTFSMNYYMFRALEKADCYKYSDRLMAGWQKMLDLHCTTWCEAPDKPRSECHGWSSAPIYEMSALTLGVCPTADGFKSVRIKPVTGKLEWAKGTVPTPYGVIGVEWKKQNGKFILDAVIPEAINMPVTVILEGKEPVCVNEHKIHIEA